LGYTYALRHNFDFVVLLHGDGQYAPEAIPDLLRPLIDDSADAVFGSRMMIPGTARRGGMPLYKFVGNKILSWLQNRLLGIHLSEFHSGFRAYRVAALGKIPFQNNTNVFHFDTEIIIQLLLAGYRITEVPIPTYYGNEICRVNGLRYAKDVLVSTIASRFHCINLLYDRKFDVDGPENHYYELKLGYPSSHSLTIETVAEGSRVLDIGCGPGHVAAELVKKRCVVDGADQWLPIHGSLFNAFYLWHDPEPLNVSPRDYDWVLLLDIIEHLRYPEKFLDALRSASHSRGNGPRFIVTTGNVAFCIVRLQMLLGRFNYGKRGILDMTHTRLYTFKSLQQLFEQCGFQVKRIKGIPAPIPLALGMNSVSRMLTAVNDLLIRMCRGVFSYQIFMIAMPTPTIDVLLDESIYQSAVRASALDRDSARSR
jgi:SAM-dependent methyltransferase